MKYSDYRNYFKNENEFEDFKKTFPHLVQQYISSYKALIANGYSDHQSDMVSRNQLHNSFMMTYNLFKNKG